MITKHTVIWQVFSNYTKNHEITYYQYTRKLNCTNEDFGTFRRKVSEKTILL